MRKAILRGGITMITLIFSVSGLGLVIPTTHKNVGVYLGLFGSNHNPAQRPGCYYVKNNVLTGKQLLEYNYTAMDCLDSNNKTTMPGTTTPGVFSNSDSIISSDIDETMRNILSRASAIQLGLNFMFNS